MMRVVNVDQSDGEPPLNGEPLERPSVPAMIGSLVAIIVPFVGLVAACVMMWNTRWSWLNLGMFIGGYLLTAMGITLGYHRLFTHKSFKTHPVVAAILGTLGSMAVEGPILQWVATHRRHHQHTDRPDDPHSPHLHRRAGSGLMAWLRGLYHAHFGWFFSRGPTRETMDRYVPDLQGDPVVRTISGLFGALAIVGILIPAAVGLAVTGTWLGALMGLIWGGLLRVFFVHHVTWSVNSVCHLWGRQPFNTRDYSRNNAIFGILALGEGWHNNHHAFPSSARHGLEWWQIDATYLVIRALSLFGLAWDIKVPSPERIAAKRVKRHAPRSTAA